jgi:glycosyl transferase, family 25
MPTVPHDFWGQLGGALAVNLDSRPDRWTGLQAQIAGLGLPVELVRLSAVRGIDLPGFGARPWFRNGKRDRNWAGRAGCTLSHRRAIEHAQKAGWSSVLILEDDAVFSPRFTAVADRLSGFLNTNRPDWTVCYLGFTQPEGPSRHLADLGDGHALHQVYGCYTTHAYLLRDTTYAWLLDQLPDEHTVWPWIARHRAIDRWYSRNLSRRFETLVVAPSLITQQAGDSDITGRAAHDGDLTAFIAPLPANQITDDVYRRRSSRHSVRVRLREAGNRLRAIGKRIHGF